MKIKDIISEGEVIQGNFGKKKEERADKGTKISALQAFGSHEMNILHDAGIHFLEKPDYWEDLDRKEDKYQPISEIIFKKVEKELAKRGYKLVTLKAEDVYGIEPKRPTSAYVKKPQEQCYVLEFSNGKRYLCDRTGANTYTRMWALIK